jgi:hypothetical protein
MFYCPRPKVGVAVKCKHLSVIERELENLLFEIISKQAQVILNSNGLDDSAGLSVKIEQQAGYEQRIEKYRDEKRTLYERFILGEIDAAAYKALKTVTETELSKLTHAFEALKTEAAVMSVVKASDDELRSLAGTALDSEKLSRPLVDALVEKVYIYPGNRVEIEWKVADFAKIEKGEKAYAK